MTWVKIDDNFPDHPKVAGLSAEAFRLHIQALCYCARYLTDGEVPRTVAEGWVPHVERWNPRWVQKHSRERLEKVQRLFRELSEASLWAVKKRSIRIHDYLEYNPSRAQIESKRASDRKRIALESRANRSAPAPTRPEPVPQPPTGLGLGSRDSTKSAVGNIADAPSKKRRKPTPSTPDSTQIYLLERILTDRPSWTGLTPGAVAKLNSQYGAGLVLEALQELRIRLAEGDVGKVESPYAYLAAMCREVTA